MIGGGLSGIPTYSDNESDKEKFSKWIVSIWPNVYRIINTSFYFIVSTTKKFVIEMIKMVFQQ